MWLLVCEGGGDNGRRNRVEGRQRQMCIRDGRMDDGVGLTGPWGAGWRACGLSGVMLESCFAQHIGSSDRIVMDSSRRGHKQLRTL